MIKYFLYFLPFIFGACEKHYSQQEITFVGDSISLENKLSIYLAQFITENPCNECTNFVYINKLYNLDTVYKNIIIIQQIPANNEMYKQMNPKPILKIKIKSSVFFLFCGIEDYFQVHSNDTTLVNRLFSNKFPTWTIIDIKNSTKIVKEKIAPPFSPFSLPQNYDIPSTIRQSPR